MKRITFPKDRRYWRTIPGKEIRGCRIDWDNQGKLALPAALYRLGTHHSVRWEARLHTGETRPHMKHCPVSLAEAIRQFSNVGDLVPQFAADLDHTFAGFVPDATTLQKVYTRQIETNLIPSPDDIADRIAAVIDLHFPKEDFHGIRIPRTGAIENVPQHGILVRIAAGAVAAAYVSELANLDSRWMEAHPAFAEPSWHIDRRRTHRIPPLPRLFEEITPAEEPKFALLPA